MVYGISVLHITRKPSNINGPYLFQNGSYKYDTSKPREYIGGPNIRQDIQWEVNTNEITLQMTLNIITPIKLKRKIKQEARILYRLDLQIWALGQKKMLIRHIGDKTVILTEDLS